MSGVAEIGGWDHGVVVFVDNVELWWLRLLRPGFRHCFVVVATAAGWVMVDPLSHRTALALLPLSKEFDLAGYYRRRGMVAVAIRNIHTPRRMAPPAVCSCVETVKRVVGIHAASVLTPWQLYRYLNKTGKFILTASEG